VTSVRHNLQCIVKLFVIASLVFFAPTLQAFTIPSLSSPVVDQAHVLSDSGQVQIDRLIRAVHDAGGTQIAVLTLSSLDGLSIEEAGIKVAEAWKLGRQDKDDGVLILIAPNERRVRIEVGYGKEGDLPDAMARRIIDQILKPSFQKSDYDYGILLAVAAIVQQTDPSFNLDSVGLPRQRIKNKNAGFGVMLKIFFLIIGIFFLTARRNRFATTTYGRSGWHGRYYGDGAWPGGMPGGGPRMSSGGWSGGGGGFGGGGSSGSW